MNSLYRAMHRMITIELASNASKFLCGYRTSYDVMGPRSGSRVCTSATISLEFNVLKRQLFDSATYPLFSSAIASVFNGLKLVLCTLNILLSAEKNALFTVLITKLRLSWETEHFFSQRLVQDAQYYCVM